MGADLDVCEAHVTIKNYFTRAPYVDASGLTTLDIPVESCEWTEVMWEPKVNDISTARITLPSLLAFPGLRSLLQNLKEGDRVEIFDKQPDAGDPVFAGFISPNGITEEGGNVSLAVDDTLGQLRWQHIRRFEYYNTNAAGFYARAMRIWTDLVTTDFTTGNPGADLATVQFGGTKLFGSGFVRLSGTGSSGSLYIMPSSVFNAGGLTVGVGDTFLLETDFVINSTFPGTLAQTQVALVMQQFTGSTPLNPRFGGFISYGQSGLGGFPAQQTCDIEIYPSGGGLSNYDPASSPSSHGTTQQTFSMPQSHHLSVFARFDQVGFVTVYVYLDNIQLGFVTQPWFFDTTAYMPVLFLNASAAGDYAQATSWRMRKLVPALTAAARFNPQTTDAVTYQPNHEENLQLLQLFAEKDNAEYRPIYHAWPQPDELEIDQASTLGKFASRLLGYEQPPALPTEGSPQVSPAPVIADAASFLVAPPFRFEEGYNLEAAPKILPRANAHANDVIRVGASTADAQVFAEKFSMAEVGRPQAVGNSAPTSGALYPYFEQITNDDRVGIQSLNASLAGLELARRIDTTPALELAVVEELPWAFRWRAGDQIFVKTQSLRTNLEQELRAQKIQYKAGSPLRTVTLGKTDWDPTMLRMLAEDTKMSWLYDQSGTSPTVYVYPNLGSLAAGAISTAFTITLDQFTTGSALVYASLHWFADANVMNLGPEINQSFIYTTGLSPASGTDSGQVVVTQYFQSPGQYSLSFKNNDASPRTLTAAFLVLRVKF